MVVHLSFSSTTFSFLLFLHSRTKFLLHVPFSIVLQTELHLIFPSIIQYNTVPEDPTENWLCQDPCNISSRHLIWQPHKPFHIASCFGCNKCVHPWPGPQIDLDSITCTPWSPFELHPHHSIYKIHHICIGLLSY